MLVNRQVVKVPIVLANNVTDLYNRASSNMLTAGATAPAIILENDHGGGAGGTTKRSAKFGFILFLFHFYANFVNHEK